MTGWILSFYCCENNCFCFVEPNVAIEAQSTYDAGSRNRIRARRALSSLCHPCSQSNNFIVFPSQYYPSNLFASRNSSLVEQLDGER